MTPKFCSFIFALAVCNVLGENRDWDLAVTIEGQIELLLSNGTLVGSTPSSYTKLKALTYDNIRHQFIVSDMNESNDTIYSISLTEEEKNTRIVEDLADDIQGLAIDPLNDVLYWTNPMNRTINFASLNRPGEYGVFMSFDDETPQDLAIDSCRRYIYWTNSNLDKPTIDRARLDGSGHEVIVDVDLKIPVGVTIDYVKKRLYWTDRGEGIHFTVESSNLEGKEREVVLLERHQKPYGLAVDEQAIYWTDVNNNALWRYRKGRDEQPYKIKTFKEKPMGLIAKHLGFAESPDCDVIERAIAEYNESIVENVTAAYVDEEEEEETVENVCLNHGEMKEDGCACKKGFKGRNCEIELCHNYCVHGGCSLTAHGYPVCNCLNGYTGTRCEYDLCHGFCLNNGTCGHNGFDARCRCPEGFIGNRCEVNTDLLKLCKSYCDSDLQANDDNYRLCNCAAYNQYKFEETAESTNTDDINLLRHPAFITLVVCMLVTLAIVVALSVAVLKNKKRRPRINKRIIVNKNVTPLTYRPQQTVDQCEITIENCCNMNVCETPCFEPQQLRKAKNAKDEKKNLLKNMETGDDLY